MLEEKRGEEEEEEGGGSRRGLSWKRRGSLRSVDEWEEKAEELVKEERKEGRKGEGRLLRVRGRICPLEEGRGEE